MFYASRPLKPGMLYNPIEAKKIVRSTQPLKTADFFGFLAVDHVNFTPYTHSPARDCCKPQVSDSEFTFPRSFRTPFGSTFL